MLLMFLILMIMIMIMMIMIMMIMIMTMTMMIVLLILMILILMFVSNGRGTCYGDSGGPAIVRQPDGSYVQVFSQHHHHHHCPHHHHLSHGVMEQLDWSFVQIQIVLLRQVGILSFGALAGCEKGYPSGQVMIGDNDENNTITQ